MSRHIGTIGVETPHWIATRAFEVAAELATTSRARLVLQIDKRKRLKVARMVDRKRDLEGLIATFTTATPRKWLEEEIAAVAA